MFKRYVTQTLFAGVLLVALGHAAEAGINVWTSQGPGGGRIVALAIDPLTPTSAYAASFDQGVYKTSDGGASWTAVNNGLTDANIRALAIDPRESRTVYAGTSFEGVYKSTDGGVSWNIVLSEPEVGALAVDPVAPTTIYAGTWGGGVFKTSDAGARWTLISIPAYSYVYPWVGTLAPDPLMPTTVYAGTDGGGVYKSVDGGATWSTVNDGLTNKEVQALAIDPLTTATVYAGTWNGGVYRTSGTSWSALNDGLTNLYVRALVIDPETPNTLFAGTYGGDVFELTQTVDLEAVKEVAGTLLDESTIFYTITLTNIGLLPQLDCPSDELVDVLPPEVALVDAQVLSGGGVVTVGHRRQHRDLERQYPSWGQRRDRDRRADPARHHGPDHQQSGTDLLRCQRRRDQ